MGCDSASATYEEYERCPAARPTADIVVVLEGCWSCRGDVPVLYLPFLLNPFASQLGKPPSVFSDVLVVGSVHGCRSSGGQPFGVPLGRHDAHDHWSLTQAMVR